MVGSMRPPFPRERGRDDLPGEFERASYPIGVLKGCPDRRKKKSRALPPVEERNKSERNERYG